MTSCFGIFGAADDLLMPATASAWPLAVSLLVYLVCVLVPVAILVKWVHLALSLPLRRNERARLVLDFLEMSIRLGRPVEQTLISIGHTRDRILDRQFISLIGRLEKGLRLEAALKQAPAVVPPQIAAMLRVGERTGDLRKVLPACRQLLNDSVSQVRGAVNYILVLAFLVTPFTIFVPFVLATFVLPKFKAVFAAMADGVSFPALSVLIFDHTRLVIGIQSAALALVWLAIFGYVGGPRLRQRLSRILGGVPDRLLYALPWRRKRLHRDFSTMLSLLLDAEVPEAEAVALAAEATSNRVMQRRADRVRAELARGIALPIAIRVMDDSGELQWRLTNALQRGRDFSRALAGWHEALEAKAFQLEQSAAQIVSSLFVLFNGFMVAAFVLAIFLALIALLNQATLW